MAICQAPTASARTLASGTAARSDPDSARSYASEPAATVVPAVSHAKSRTAPNACSRSASIAHPQIATASFQPVGDAEEPRQRVQERPHDGPDGVDADEDVRKVAGPDLPQHLAGVPLYRRGFLAVLLAGLEGGFLTERLGRPVRVVDGHRRVDARRQEQADPREGGRHQERDGRDDERRGRQARLAGPIRRRTAVT